MRKGHQVDNQRLGLQMISNHRVIIPTYELDNPYVLPNGTTDCEEGNGTEGVGGGKKRMPSCNGMDSPYG